MLNELIKEKEKNKKNPQKRKRNENWKRKQEKQKRKKKQWEMQIILLLTGKKRQKKSCSKLFTCVWKWKSDKNPLIIPIKGDNSQSLTQFLKDISVVLILLLMKTSGETIQGYLSVNCISVQNEWELLMSSVRQSK